jgi:hypothetical protein
MMLNAKYSSESVDVLGIFICLLCLICRTICRELDENIWLSDSVTTNSCQIGLGSLEARSRR